MSSVLDIFDRIIALRLVEAWPAAVGVELRVRLKQKRIATAAVEAAGALFLEKFTGVGALSAGHPKNVIFEVTELLPPLLVSFEDFVLHLFAFHAVYNLRITTFIAWHFPVRLCVSSFN